MKVQTFPTMEEAWAESARLEAKGNRLWDESLRLWPEADHLWAEADQVVIATAEALFGKDAVIDWEKRTVTRKGTA